MSLDELKEFSLDSIFLIECTLPDNSKRRGTCFSIGQDLLLTAAHVLTEASSVKVFLTSDAYDAGESFDAHCIYENVELDVAILELPKSTTSNSISLYATSVNMDCEVRSCGYPVEKEHYHAPIKVNVTNTFEHMTSREYSFEISQSATVSKYSGMSGSPVMYNNHCIGILLVQQGSNTLYVVSTKDFLNDGSIHEIFKN